MSGRHDQILNGGGRAGYPRPVRLSRCKPSYLLRRQWREAVPETQGAMVDAVQATHGNDSAGDGVVRETKSLVITKISDFRTTSLTGPQDNCVTEARATVRSRGRRQGRPLENRGVRTTDASAWPGCSRSVASGGRRTDTPAWGDLPLTTQTDASWNLEGCWRPISHGGIPPRSRGGGGQCVVTDQRLSRRSPRPHGARASDTSEARRE